MEISVTPLGDLHNGRQTCLIQSGTDTYISKPRSSKNEEAFDLFCQKIAKLGLVEFSRAPYIIEKGENEHTQRVEENEITDDNGADLYYKRAGVLLFFTYLLGSNDLHCENLIANKDMPVLIDLETLLTGKARGTADAYNLSKSVMRSHLLCNFIRGKTNIVDVSGFCGVISDMKNIPKTEKGRVFLWDKREVFSRSFEEAYRFTLEHKKEISEFIHIFDRCEFRQILRPTKTYSVISTILSKLGDEKEDYATALLSKAYEKDIDKNRLEKAKLVLQNEIDSVLKEEIPLFYSYGNETALYCNNQKVLDDHLMLSPVDYALARLESLSEQDMLRQLDIISLAIDASTPLDKANKPVFINSDSMSAGEVTAATVTNYSVEGLDTMFCGLQSDSSGNVNFISYNSSLYQGLCGILCMYAALFRKTGKTIYRDYLYKFYENVRKTFLTDNSKIVLTNKNCSLADGITGVISCMEHIGRLTEDKIFIDDARSVANRLYISNVVADIDYLNGFGAILPVLKKVKAESFYDISLNLADAFENPMPFTTGVAHGASGIALSLCALSTADTEEKIEKNILSVLQWENEHYSEENNNWFDLRDKTKKGFMSGWCSGAPGIGMARKHIEKNTRNAQIKKLCETDLKRAESFLKAQSASKRDTLCCGTASKLMSASVLGISVDDLYTSLCDAEKRQELRTSHLVNTNDRNVSLMQGLSGVAYALVMYGDPLCGGMLI